MPADVATCLGLPPVTQVHGEPVDWKPWTEQPRILCPQVGNSSCEACGYAKALHGAFGHVLGLLALRAVGCPACGHIDVTYLDSGELLDDALPPSGYVVDYAGTSKAAENREEKARVLDNACWHAGLTPADVEALDAAARRHLARHVAELANVPTEKPGPGPLAARSLTWARVLERLTAREVWAAAHPDDPRAARSATHLRGRYVAAAPHVPAQRQGCDIGGENITANVTPPSDVHEPPAHDDEWVPPHLLRCPPVPRAAWPRGWDAVAALPPVPDRSCYLCPNPAVLTTPMTDGGPVWRCPDHPPTGEDWGARGYRDQGLNWAPKPCLQPLRCYCGRHDYQAAA